jgi:hypothetical protein
MPNPITVNCPDGEWTLVAEDQVWGQIYRLDNKPAKYLYTYRLTGEDPPTLQTEGAPIFLTADRYNLVAGVGVDVYIMAVGNAGKVRYDWWF